MQNSSWFGDLNVAKSYKTKETNIYRWKTKKITNLLKINIKNEEFIENIFKKTNLLLNPTIFLTKEQINKLQNILETTFKILLNIIMINNNV
jgi:hypothetical protein